MNAEKKEQEADLQQGKGRRTQECVERQQNFTKSILEGTNRRHTP
ncbi:hypothetical protein [Blastopirellula sp. J2-11]|nr:hypothetical protein [Blastopirellula sp. J2-11]